MTDGQAINQEFLGLLEHVHGKEGRKIAEILAVEIVVGFAIQLVLLPGEGDSAPEFSRQMPSCQCFGKRLSWWL